MCPSSVSAPGGGREHCPAWITRYLTLAVVGVRSEEVADKIALHLERFAPSIRKRTATSGSRNVLKRDVLAWQRSLSDQGLAPATVNNHLASLSAFTDLGPAPRPRTSSPSAIRPRGSASWACRRSSRGPSRLSRSAR